MEGMALVVTHLRQPLLQPFCRDLLAPAFRSVHPVKVSFFLVFNFLSLLFICSSRVYSDLSITFFRRWGETIPFNPFPFIRAMPLWSFKIFSPPYAFFSRSTNLLAKPFLHSRPLSPEFAERV